MKRGRKGQVTVFIVIALIIVGGITGYFVIKNISQGPAFEELGFNEKVGVVKEAVDTCFELVYKDSLDFVGAQGGYYQEPFGFYMTEDGLYLPIYSLNGENITIPSKEFIEEEISLAVDESLETCLYVIENQYSIINIDYEEYITEVNIFESSVKFDTPISITLSAKEGEGTAQIETDRKEIKSDLDNMIKVADYYISSQIIDKDLICIDCITEMAETYDLTIEVLNYIEDAIIVSIYSNNEGNYPASYNFLEVYNRETTDFTAPTFSGTPLADDEELSDDELNIPAPTI